METSTSSVADNLEGVETLTLQDKIVADFEACLDAFRTDGEAQRALYTEEMGRTDPTYYACYREIAGPVEGPEELGFLVGYALLKRSLGMGMALPQLPHLPRAGSVQRGGKNMGAIGAGASIPVQFNVPVGIIGVPREKPRYTPEPKDAVLYGFEQVLGESPLPNLISTIKHESAQLGLKRALLYYCRTVRTPST